MRIDIAALLFTPLLHGLYDFFALYDDFKRFSVAAILFLAVQCRISYRIQAEEKEKADIRPQLKNTEEKEKAEKPIKKITERKTQNRIRKKT